MSRGDGRLHPLGSRDLHLTLLCLADGNRGSDISTVNIGRIWLLLTKRRVWQHKVSLRIYEQTAYVAHQRKGFRACGTRSFFIGGKNPWLTRGVIQVDATFCFHMDGKPPLCTIQRDVETGRFRAPLKTTASAARHEERCKSIEERHYTLEKQLKRQSKNR